MHALLSKHPSCTGRVRVAREIAGPRAVLREERAIHLGRRAIRWRINSHSLLVPLGEMKLGVQEGGGCCWGGGGGGLQRTERRVLAKRGGRSRPLSQSAFAVTFHSVSPKITVRASRLISGFFLLPISWRVIRVWSYGSLPTICAFSNISVMISCYSFGMAL